MTNLESGIGVRLGPDVGRVGPGPLVAVDAVAAVAVGAGRRRRSLQPVQADLDEAKESGREWRNLLGKSHTKEQ